MKTNKLLAAGALALSMAMTPVASLINAMPVMAAKIELPKDGDTYVTTHTYEIYQIFTGTYSNGTLSDIKWGVNGKGTQGSAVPNETVQQLTGITSTLDKEKLNTIKTFLTTDEDGKLVNPITTLNSTKPITDNLADGYYLIKDVDGSLTNQTDEAYTLYITQVIGNETYTITPKTGIPRVDKEVYDDADPDNQGAGWKEAADHDLNTVFQFRLTGTVDASTLARYNTYKMVFHDTLSKGVSYEGEVEVFVNDSTTPLSPSNYTVSDAQTGEDGKTTFSVTFNNVNTDGFKDTDGNVKIQIVYNAKLTDAAVVNDNSGKIGNDNTVYLEYSNNPNSEGTGNTKEDKVFVASFKLLNTKVDGAGEKNNDLSGAEFAVISGKNSAAFKVVDGKYMFQHWITEDNPKGNDEVDVVTTNAGGDFSVYGLDAGSYILRETKTWDGYNTAPDTTFTVKATHDEDEGGQTATVTIADDSALNHEVTNTKNGSLPETGGMGTTMIYGVGAVMVAGAAVFYVTNKRTRKD
ncbi:isopeptide-forming domain-containing fimbrial protein [Faecalibaculum rodentium]|nr:isopeptide-forming domain-containing fimbrial protein [Faecalibaculum rodentium]